MNRLIHTPEGVRDYLNMDCARKMAISNMLDELMKSYGYHFIQTPIFEFFDIFNKERGSASSREMYKFFDHNNETLVLRPDITPSIARAVSKYYEDEDLPLRLCYNGNTFINNMNYQGRLKEMTYVGCELINDETTEADAEMIALTINALKKSGLKDFFVEVGNVEFFNGLMDESGLGTEEVLELRNLVENKNYFAIERLLSSTSVDESIKELILKMPQMFGNIETILKVKSKIKNERSLHAIERLEKVYDLLGSYGLSEYVTFDLGMLSKYQYYTGIVFQAITYGTGENIAGGGRYDKLLLQYGKDCAAVGCAIKLDVLVLALTRQDVKIKTDISSVMLLYGRDCKAKAIKKADELRSEGKRVVAMRKFDEKTTQDYIAYAKRNYITDIIELSLDGMNTISVSEEEI